MLLTLSILIFNFAETSNHPTNPFSSHNLSNLLLSISASSKSNLLPKLKMRIIYIKIIIKLLYNLYENELILKSKHPTIKKHANKKYEI